MRNIITLLANATQNSATAKKRDELTSTNLSWVGPVILLGIVISILYFALKQRTGLNICPLFASRQTPPPALSDSENSILSV